jgi:HEAT repeat protein
MTSRMLNRLFVSGLVLLLSTGTSSAADAPSDEFVQMIVKLIGDGDKEFRAAGLEQVRKAAPGAKFTTLFAAQLKKLDASGQTALLSALADRGDAAARPAVLELLASSSDAGVRVAAIGALGGVGGADDLPLLFKTLSATSNAEQAAARKSLVQLRGETISKALATETKSAPPAVKAALIDVLATRRASDEMPAFLAATVDDNAQVRSAAMAALGQLGRPEQIKAMLPGVLKAQKGGERDAAERNVALVCARIGNEDQRGIALIEALDTIDVAQRDQLLALVGRVGGKKLINFVADIATGKDIARRQLGIDALSKWPDASVADKLLEIVKQATDPAERNQAFQGYVKISATRDNRSDKQRLERMKQAMQVAQTPEEQSLVINRCRTAYDVDSVRFVLPYVEQPQFAQLACETIVEVAHHREVRDPHKAEFDKVLDKVIEVSKDPVIVDRANRYKRGETWERPRGK